MRHSKATKKPFSYSEMPNNIPAGIAREHLLAAIRDLDAGAVHRFGMSTGYDVLHEGRRYPPKPVVGLAAGKLTGKLLGPYDFKGGLGTKCFKVLASNGFDIVPKQGADARPVQRAGK